MAEAKTKPKVELKWEGCECGCKSAVLRIGRMVFNTSGIGGEGFHLSWGHLTGGYLATYPTREARDEAVLAMPHVQREIAEIKKQAELFKDLK